MGRQLLIIMSLAFGWATTASGSAAACLPEIHDGSDYTVCRFDVSVDRIDLFWRDEEKRPYGAFRPLAEAIRPAGKALVFGMNAGMYDDRLAPIGLYVEDGREHKPANTRDGPGNFHLKPNGVFFVANGRAGVMETKEFLGSGIKPRIATQSGPMLVIDGNIHPRFLEDSTSRKRRNGVGVGPQGRKVVFVISEDFVTFHAFASLFRDKLKTPNALFFDGTVSSLHAQNLNRSDWGRPMGPIVGVIREME